MANDNSNNDFLITSQLFYLLRLALATEKDAVLPHEATPSGSAELQGAVLQGANPHEATPSGGAALQAAIPSGSAAPSTWDWSQLYRLAQRNKVQSIAWLGVERLPQELKDGLPDSLAAKWQASVNQVIKRRATFDYEREQLYEQMSHIGLRFMPVKGAQFAGYYPHFGMRDMVDNDILYDFAKEAASDVAAVPSAQNQGDLIAKLSALMVSLGYTVESQGTGIHEVYTKPPCLNFEMHRALLHDIDRGYQHFADPWSLACQDSKNPNLYYLRLEDQYLHMLAHAYNHLESSGVGIRFLCDGLVLLRQGDANFDWPYVLQQAQSMGLAPLERFTRRIAVQLLGLRNLSHQLPEAYEEQQWELGDKELLVELTLRGLSHTMDAYATNALVRLQAQGMDLHQAQRSYIKSRIFPSREELQRNHPFFAKPGMRILYPFYKLGCGLSHKPSRVAHELKAVAQAKPQGATGEMIAAKHKAVAEDASHV